MVVGFTCTLNKMSNLFENGGSSYIFRHAFCCSNGYCLKEQVEVSRSKFKCRGTKEENAAKYALAIGFDAKSFEIAVSLAASYHC